MSNTLRAPPLNRGAQHLTPYPRAPTTIRKLTITDGNGLYPRSPMVAGYTQGHRWSRVIPKVTDGHGLHPRSPMATGYTHDGKARSMNLW